MMRLHKTDIPGLYLMNLPYTKDHRGEFFKSYRSDEMESQGLHFQLREEFFSISSKHVLRGMHFQVPPFDHNKIVTCLTGCILDVVLDLRTDSQTFGQHYSIVLRSENRQSLWIPKGLAHGFLSQEDQTLVSYKTDREFSPNHDKGVHWNSFGMDWGEGGWIISERDQNHPGADKYHSPF